MRFLAILLLLGVFIMHTGLGWMPANSRFSYAAIHYMASGLWQATLGFVLLVLLWHAKRTTWSWLAIVACGITISEGSQMAVCRALVVDRSKVPTDVNLCDYVTGLPVGAVMVSLYLIFICWSLRYANRTD